MSCVNCMMTVHFRLARVQEKIVTSKLNDENCVFFLHTVHKKPLREVEIAAICQDALQVQASFELIHKKKKLQRKLLCQLQL